MGLCNLIIIQFPEPKQLLEHLFLQQDLVDSTMTHLEFVSNRLNLQVEHEIVFLVSQLIRQL